MNALEFRKLVTALKDAGLNVDFYISQSEMTKTAKIIGIMFDVCIEANRYCLNVAICGKVINADVDGNFCLYTITYNPHEIEIYSDNQAEKIINYVAGHEVYLKSNFSGDNELMKFACREEREQTGPFYEEF